MEQENALPPGQREIDSLPRFGLNKFANRFPLETEETVIDIGGDVLESMRLTADLDGLNPVEQVSDFHCVTTWTKRNVSWGGFRFSDFYNQLVVKQAQSAPNIEFVILYGLDGYRVGMCLEDLLASDVLLADKLDGQALPAAHGAPLRLVAPAHYGYKSIKHINRIEFWSEVRAYKHAGLKFMDHPRARVKFEERGTSLPGWVFRFLYRPLVEPTRRKFAKALAAHLSAKK